MPKNIKIQQCLLELQRKIVGGVFWDTVYFVELCIVDEFYQSSLILSPSDISIPVTYLQILVKTGFRPICIKHSYCLLYTSDAADE